MLMLIWPPIRSETACAATAIRHVGEVDAPPSRWNSSPAMCGGVPIPGEPKLSRPGCSFASATSSATDRTGSADLTASTKGPTPMRVIGAKSASAS